MSDRFATAISILNSQIKINAVVKKSEHFGSLYWNGKNHQIMELEDIPKSANISIGDTIFQGGCLLFFPEIFLLELFLILNCQNQQITTIFQ